ncbi:MAG: hypothetical protein AAF750_16835 [Planctomycetota bacterium]
MRFRVGPFEYRLELVEDDIRFEGEVCLGLCDNTAQVLYVSAACSPTQRLQVLCHEYMEAWWYHFGQTASDKEGWCDLFGLAMTQFVQDLMESGGVDAAVLWEASGPTTTDITRDKVLRAGAEPASARVGIRLESDRIVSVGSTQRNAAGTDGTDGTDRWRVRVFAPDQSTSASDG